MKTVQELATERALAMGRLAPRCVTRENGYGLINAIREMIGLDDLKLDPGMPGWLTGQTDGVFSLDGKRAQSCVDWARELGITRQAAHQRAIKLEAMLAAGDSAHKAWKHACAKPHPLMVSRGKR